MQKFFTWVSFVAVLALLVAGCAQPAPIAPGAVPAATSAAGQESGGGASAAPAVAQPGGVWRQADIADAEMLNPILSSDNASAEVSNFLFPSLVAQDPVTGVIVPDGSMSESWEVSADGLIWTFHLRAGVLWSDGDPVDAADFKFTYDAVGDDQIETPRKSMLEGIERIETPDPLTVVITFSEVRCDGLNNLILGWLPSHLYAADFSDIMENKYNEAPPVSAGPFLFNSWTRDDNLTVTRNETYWEGAPNLEGMIFKVVPDPGAQLAQFQSGEIDVMGLQPNQLASAQGIADTKLFNFQDDGYDFIALNLANPKNPQAGLDDSDNPIEQEAHPILGDLNVRQAIAHSLDYQTIIDKVYLGQGYQIPANVLPAISWAYNAELQPYAYDLETAKQLLEEAGWTDSDGDGVREKDGNQLALVLVTNAGNTTREDLGALVQDQLREVGFAIDFQTIDFGLMIDQMLGQTYDMALIGWTGTGTDPNDESLWSAEYDTPGSGFNFVSYHNPKVEELLQQGVNVSGCDTAERAPAYQAIQQIIHDEVPYVFISGNVGNTAYSTKWQGLDPGPWNFYYNVHLWSLSQ